MADCGVVGGAVGTSFGAEVWWIIESSVLAGAAGDLIAHANFGSSVVAPAGHWCNGSGILHRRFLNNAEFGISNSTLQATH